MAMALFGVVFPAIAASETRVFIIPEDSNQEFGAIPAGEYGLMEWYCNEPGCDCRRVMIHVVARRGMAHVASINHAFDPPAPDAPGGITVRTFLDPLNKQTKFSNDILRLCTELVLSDDAYCQRLVRHYKMFKEVVNNPKHPRRHVLFPGAVGPAERKRPKRPPFRG